MTVLDESDRSGVRTLNIILVVVFIIDVVSILDVNLESLTVRREIIKAITRKRSVQLGSASVALLSFPNVQWKSNFTVFRVPGVYTHRQKIFAAAQTYQQKISCFKTQIIRISIVNVSEAVLVQESNLDEFFYCQSTNVADDNDLQHFQMVMLFCERITPKIHQQ